MMMDRGAKVSSQAYSSVRLRDDTDLSRCQSIWHCTAVELLGTAQHPVILAGVEFHRFDLEDKLLKLLEVTGYPIATTMLGKSCISEMHPQFIGNYIGGLSREYIRDRIENADCLLCLGAIMSDMNLGAYTAKLDDYKLINANSEKVKIKHHFYQPIYLGDFIDGLIEHLNHKAPETLNIKPRSYSLSQAFTPRPEEKLTNVRFYERAGLPVTSNKCSSRPTTRSGKSRWRRCLRWHRV